MKNKKEELPFVSGEATSDSLALLKPNFLFNERLANKKDSVKAYIQNYYQ